MSNIRFLEEEEYEGAKQSAQKPVSENLTRTRASHPTGTELCTWIGNKLGEARGMDVPGFNARERE